MERWWLSEVAMEGLFVDMYFFPRLIQVNNDELHPLTNSSEAGLGYTTDSTALPRGIRQISICVYY